MRAAENRYSISTVLILYIYTTCHSIKSQNNLSYPDIGRHIYKLINVLLL